MMACCYLENLKQRKQRKSQRWGCQDLKNTVGLQVISSMLEISTIYFYTDKVFSKWLPVWSPPAGSLGCWNLATSCLSVQDTGLHSGVPGSPLDPDHHMVRGIGDIFLLPVAMTRILSVPWCRWSVEPSDDSFFKKCTSYFPHEGEPPATMSDSACVTCASWESSFKLVKTRPSSAYMVGLHP